MKPTYILSIDIGTSSVRAALYDMKGEMLPETFVKNERTLTATEDGGAEIDAEEALEQIERAIDGVLRKAKKIEGDIRAVAASSFWHSLLGIDRSGWPTTKVFGWADTRSRAFVAELRKKLDEQAVHNRTGARFHPSFWPAKLLWLRRTFPEVFKETSKWLSFSDFVALRFFAASTVEMIGAELDESGGHLSMLSRKWDLEAGCLTSVSMASATGIFDIRRNEWDAELLKFLKLKPENLPRIVERDARTFSLNEEYAERWKRLKDAEWFLAIGDGAANNIGAGCVRKTKAALMIGTSGAMRVAFRGNVPERIPEGLWCYRIDRKRVIIGGALSDGGGLYRWLKDNFRLKKDDDETEREIERRAPDGHGLVFLPFLAGERSTGYHENAQGAILGLKTANDFIDIVQAALESVAYRFAEIFDQLNDVAKIREIVASGGALRESPVWTQIIADTLAKNLHLPDVREASSRGAVLLALESLGKIESIEKPDTPKGRQFRFDKKRHAVYRKARARHGKFYELLMNADDSDKL
jgi:Sugar (pentulose and hexulose) kinases